MKITDLVVELVLLFHRFSGFNTTESAEVNSKTLKQATDKREEAFLAIGSMQPSTPNSGSPRSRSHNRRFSESGSQTPFLRSPADQADACFQQISTGGQDSIASPSLRRRRATDMGYSTSTMQAVIDK